MNFTNFRQHGKRKDARPVYAIFLLIIVSLVNFPLLAVPSVVPSEQEQKVRQFMAAFNARNLDAMLAAVDEDIQWLSVDGAKITVETDGKKALRESMEKYFRGCSSCQSSLEWIQVAGNRVTALERASWKTKNGDKAQKSLSVYEFRANKILRVYYFPAEPEAMSASK